MTTVALPVETKNRELYGKTWLGLCLLDRGYDVVIGESRELKYWLDTIQPEIYITKDVGDTNLDFITNLVDAGVLVCGIDPEDGVVGADRKVNKIDNKQTVLDYLSVYFSWGEVQTDALRSIGSDCRIVTTGNPRFDLLSPSLRNIYSEPAEKITEKYGEYILFNTNFVSGNHYDPEMARKQRQKYYDDDQIELIRYTTRLRHYFTQAILAVDSITENETVIVRPHPSENHQTYIDEFKWYENIVVDHSDDVRPWILGSEAVVHNGCTTGIESALLNTPVISYEPIENKEYGRPLPNLVSQSVSNIEFLCTALEEYLQSDSPYEMTSSQRTGLKQYFQNVDSVAAKSMGDEIDKLDTTSPISADVLQLGPRDRLIKNAMTLPYSNVIESAYDRFTGYNKGYYDQKFSGLSGEELRSVCILFDDFLPYDIGLVQINPIGRSRNVFSITLGETMSKNN